MPNLLLAAFAATAAAGGGVMGPCDILGASGNPCVAAHSTVRALFAEYGGPLYTVTRSSDGRSASIGVLEAGGFADTPAHDEFCPEMDCVISTLFDQSPMKNHLGQRDKPVNASRHSITVGKGRDKSPVYGMWFEPGFGYHVDQTRGVATGNDPESIYAVMSGKNFNDGCCFDYGNSESDDTDDGCGTMEAIYFGNAHWAGNSGAGNGPWVGADLEEGMYYGGGNVTKVNSQSRPLAHDFVSLALKGRRDGFTIKGGDATSGMTATMYDGPRPDTAIAGRCGVGSSVTLQHCAPGDGNQVWGFKQDGESIASDGQCLDISNWRTTKGSSVWAYPCKTEPARNEFWDLQGGTIRSLQLNTPFCLGTQGVAVGATTMLDSCTAASSAFAIGFTNRSSSGTIVQKVSGLCLTRTGVDVIGYQPMRKQGAIVLSTGGDNSNRAQGTFYEGFMATGYATDETDAAIQDNIVAVGYSGFSIPHAL